MDQKLPAIACDDDKVPAAAAATATTSTTSDGQPSQLHPFARSTRGRTLVSQVTVGSYVSIYWPLDEMFYPARVVGAATAASSSFTVAYTDGSVETLNLHQEKFRLLDDESEFVKGNGIGLPLPVVPERSLQLPWPRHSLSMTVATNTINRSARVTMRKFPSSVHPRPSYRTMYICSSFPA